MKIVVGKTSGFCKGVEFTIKEATKLVNNNDKVNCLNELVHNERVISDLESQGMHIVHSLDEVEDNSYLIIRAHGDTKETYEEAKKKNIIIKDLTCGKIKLIRKKILDHLNDYYIIIIGKKNHPEALGLLSFAGNNSLIIENREDIFNLQDKYNNSGLNKIFIVSQTTFNSNKFDKLVNLVKENLTGEIVVDKTICNATSNRQEETRNLASVMDVMLIVGGKNSSNTKELENVAKEECSRVYLIQDKSDLINIDLAHVNKLGIMAGASTPNIVVNEIINEINSCYN